ncbi:MAG: ABC transporter permease subunit [bacterium]
MKMTWVLFVKEVKSLFNSWIAYVALIAFTLLNGIAFYINLSMFQKMVRYADSLEKGMSRQDWNLLEQLVQPLYNTIFALLFIMVPAITMRMFAEEKKQRTQELLLTSPVKVGHIIGAKYLAALVLITLMLIPVIIFPSIIYIYGQPSPDWGPMVTGFIGLFLLGYGLAAIGLFASSVTENQIVAFMIAVAVEMLFFIVARATVSFDIVQIGDMMINVGAFLKALSITEHFSPLLQGIFRVSDLVYFFSLTGFWLWATRQSVESARWAG